MIFSKDWVEKWHVHPFGKREYDFVDGLRGLAILMVVSSHILWVNPNSSDFIRFIGCMFHSGCLGVTLFFVLSGFLIALPFWKAFFAGSDSCTPKGYAMRRFWKIYPPLALSVLILLPYYIVRRGHPEEYLITALQWWTGIPIVFPVSSRMNPVMWSLVLEVQFYITLPIFFHLVRRRGIATAFLGALLLFLIIPGVAWWIYSQFGLHPTIHPFIQMNYPTGLINFPVGVIFAALVASDSKHQWFSKIGYLGLLMIGIAVFDCSYCFFHSAEIALFPKALMMIASGGCLFFVFNQSNHGAKLLCMPWIRWLGMISYEWYLLHQPLFHLLWNAKGGGSIVRYLWVVLGSGGGSLILAALMYRYFSLPILKWARARR